MTTFAGLPVYIADSANNGLNTISVTPNNIPYDEFNVSIGVAPLKLDVAFPDIDWDSISDEENLRLNSKAVTHLGIKRFDSKHQCL